MTLHFVSSIQKQMSVCQITKPQTHSATGEPIENGLHDSRLGDIERGNEENPGYFGHIEV